MSPYLLENLYRRLGQPRWFWPCVMAALLGMVVLGSSVSPEWELWT
jgi:hypothetical protein